MNSLGGGRSILTADVAAAAVIAAARAYGDDPVYACICQLDATPRRALAAAAGGLALAGAAPWPVLERVFSVSHIAVSNKRRVAAFVEAQDRARKAALRMMPAPPPCVLPSTPSAEAAIDDLIVAALAGGPLNSMSLSSMLGRKEMAVVAALAGLKAANRVSETPSPDGLRRFVFALAAPVEAAPAKRPILREVLDVLICEPSTGPDLMDILDLSEAEIRAALSELEAQRKVRPSRLTNEGWSQQFWRPRDEAA